MQNPAIKQLMAYARTPATNEKMEHERHWSWWKWEIEMQVILDQVQNIITQGTDPGRQENREAKDSRESGQEDDVEMSPAGQHQEEESSEEESEAPHTPTRPVQTGSSQEESTGAAAVPISVRTAEARLAAQAAEALTALEAAARAAGAEGPGLEALLSVVRARLLSEVALVFRV